MINETNLNQHDLLIMDINYEEGSDTKISPPLKFLSKSFFNKLVSLCKKDVFLIAVNILCYSDKPKEEL